MLNRIPNAPARLILAGALCLAFIACAQGAAATGISAHPTPVNGIDYTTINAPDQPSGMKVQLVEVFGYGCHFCAALQPDLEKWKKTLPNDVQFGYLPGPFGGLPDAFMRAFYAAQAMGVEDKSHDAIFKAVFVDKRVNSVDDIPKLYSDYGVEPKVFASTMHSFAVGAKAAAAEDQVVRWGIEGTPTLVIDGKYRVQELKVGDAETMFRTAEWLIAHQRSARAKH